MDRLGHHELDVRSISKDARIAAIGPATAARIRDIGLRVDVIPKEYRAEALLDEISADEVKGKRILIPRAKVAREILPEKLRDAGAEVFVPPAYESVPSDEGRDVLAGYLEAGEVDCVTFTASSTVENFVQAFGEEDSVRLLAGAVVACIGPITADTARGHGIRVDAEAKEYTIPGLVEAIENVFVKPGTEG